MDTVQKPWDKKRGIYSIRTYTQRGLQKLLNTNTELGVTDVTTRTAKPIRAIRAKHYPAVCNTVRKHATYSNFPPRLALPPRCSLMGFYRIIRSIIDRMSIDSSKAFCQGFSVDTKISRDSAVEHRKKQGLRYVLKCVAVDYRCTSSDERESVLTTVLGAIPQVRQL